MASECLGGGGVLQRRLVSGISRPSVSISGSFSYTVSFSFYGSKTRSVAGPSNKFLAIGSNRLSRNPLNTFIVCTVAICAAKLRPASVTASCTNQNV